MSYILKSGEIVINKQNGHISAEIIPLLGDFLKRIHSQNRDIIETNILLKKEYDCPVIYTEADDDIFFAKRPGRWGHSRFVRNRCLGKSNQLTVVLSKSKEEADLYIIETAYIGHYSPPEPWDKIAFSKMENPGKARIQSIKYWSKHAFVASSTDYVGSTICKRPPSRKK